MVFHLDIFAHQQNGKRSPHSASVTYPYSIFGPRILACRPFLLRYNVYLQLCDGKILAWRDVAMHRNKSTEYPYNVFAHHVIGKTLFYYNFDTPCDIGRSKVLL